MKTGPARSPSRRDRRCANSSARMTRSLRAQLESRGAHHRHGPPEHRTPAPGVTKREQLRGPPESTAPCAAIIAYLTGEVGKTQRVRIAVRKQGGPRRRAVLRRIALDPRGPITARSMSCAARPTRRKQRASPPIHLDAGNAANLALASMFELHAGDIVFVAEQPVTAWNRVDQPGAAEPIPQRRQPRDPVLTPQVLGAARASDLVRARVERAGMAQEAQVGVPDLQRGQRAGDVGARVKRNTPAPHGPASRRSCGRGQPRSRRDGACARTRRSPRQASRQAGLRSGWSGSAPAWTNARLPLS